MDETTLTDILIVTTTESMIAWSTKIYNASESAFTTVQNNGVKNPLNNTNIPTTEDYIPQEIYSTEIDMNETQTVGRDTTIADYSAITKSCEVYNFVVMFVNFGLICTLGFVGNIISQCVFWPRVNKNSTAFLLTTLAVCDNG